MIVLDVETTGEVPWLNSILSIGAVDFSNPSNQFYGECRIRDGAEIDPVALEINGFTREEIYRQDKKRLRELLAEFLDWASRVNDNTLAGTNHYMDVYFIEHSLDLYKMQNPFKYRLVDTHTLTYVDYLKRGLEIPMDKNGSAIDSATYLKYCGLPKEQTPHNALNGAKIEAEALSRLIYGKNLLPEFSSYPVPGHLKRQI